MELMPALEIGWLNGWPLLALQVLVQGLLFRAFPKEVVARLTDRSGWTRREATLTVVGKLFALVSLVLIVLTPLKLGSGVFVAGVLLYALGLAGLVVAFVDYRKTPPAEPVTRGLYRVSRHPQVVAFFVLGVGMCLAIGSWAALLALLVARMFEHFGLVLAEERVCLTRYGEPYRTYTERVSRYLPFL